MDIKKQNKPIDKAARQMARHYAAIRKEFMASDIIFLKYLSRECKRNIMNTGYVVSSGLQNNFDNSLRIPGVSGGAWPIIWSWRYSNMQELYAIIRNYWTQLIPTDIEYYREVISAELTPDMTDAEIAEKIEFILVNMDSIVPWINTDGMIGLICCVCEGGLLRNCRGD